MPEDNLLAFLEDLGDLCRRHGVWIEQFSETTLPILRPAMGSERGYLPMLHDRGMGVGSIHMKLIDDEKAKSIAVRNRMIVGAKGIGTSDAELADLYGLSVATIRRIIREGRRS